MKRSGGTQLYAIMETGEEHGGMCFGDGVQYTTGCTFGKGNIRKKPRGKLAFTLIDKDSNRAVRVSYKPTLQKQIAASAFMQQRAAGYQPDEIPEADQMELVNLVWNAPEADILTVGEVFDLRLQLAARGDGLHQVRVVRRAGGARVRAAGGRAQGVHPVLGVRSRETMSPELLYIISAVLVFVFSGLLAMAGLGAAFLFVPLFYYLGVPLAEATPTALLLNVVSLLFATINYWRGKLINFRVGLPVLIVAVILSPFGARLTPHVDKTAAAGACSPPSWSSPAS